MIIENRDYTTIMLPKLPQISTYSKLVSILILYTIKNIIVIQASFHQFHQYKYKSSFEKQKDLTTSHTCTVRSFYLLVDEIHT